jgi:ABC-2 type transport system ATP-binding protein
LSLAPYSPPIVRFVGTSRRFGDLVALRDVSFEVRRGEVFGLLGPNGAGKTTALRILCGLLEPTEGRVFVGEHDVWNEPLQARRLVSFVPDGAPLYANLSPRQHLALVGRLHGLDEARIASETSRLLDALDLADRADDPVGQFSRGMRQKTALACAVLPKPALLVLDEPLNGLDASTTAVFKEVLKAWAARGGAVLYTSHLMDVVERVCDRMAVLAKGELVGLGSLDELRALAGEGGRGVTGVGASRAGTLEEVFGALTKSEDPRAKAERLLGG